MQQRSVWMVGACWMCLARAGLVSAGLVSAGLACAGGLGACGLVRGQGSNTIATQASHEGVAGSLALQGLRSVFVRGEAAIADAYLTSLPEAALRGEVDLAGVSGVLLHAHVLTQPKAGRTPIATSATTTTLRLLVVSGGEAGLYAGGGFADFDVEAGSLRGAVRDASMRLVRATPGFVDALGPSALTLRIDAKEDEASSAEAERVFVVVMERMEESE
jgi:hypothetical protein